MKFLAFLAFSVGVAHAEGLPQLIQRMSGPLAPSADRCEEQVSCSQTYVRGSGKNLPGICNEYAGNPSAFLARYQDGSVVVNPVAIDEAINYRMEDQDAKHPDSSRGRRSPSGRSQRGTDPELLSMFSNVSTNPAVIRNMNRTLDLLKTQLREQIGQDTPADQLSAQQRFLLTKLDRMTITFNYSQECEDYPFNASYSGVLNTLNMCPLLTHLAPESYIALLSHELGHMIDPCSFFDNHRFSPELAALSQNEAAQKDMLRAQINRCLDDVAPAERQRFSDWATAPSRMANQGLTVYRFEPDEGGNRALIQKLQGCGVVRAPENPAPLTYEGTPYLPMISCVSQGYSQSRAAITAATRISSATCDRSTKMMETIADYVGSALTARVLNRAPSAIASDRRNAIPGFYSSVVCGGSDSPEYLSAPERMNLFLQPASIQSAVGCEPSELRPVCALPSALTGE